MSSTEIYGAYDGLEARARRREGVEKALDRFGAIKTRFEAAYAMPLPRHLAYGGAFFLGLSPQEKAHLPVGLFGLAGWFQWLEPGGRELVASLDERLEGRFRRDPPEFVSVASGDSDGSHWGLFYDDPSIPPRLLAHGWARDDGAVWAASPTLLGSIRRPIAEAASHGDQSDRRRVRAVVGWLDALRVEEDRALVEECVPPPPPASERADLGGAGLGPHLPGWTPPAWLPGHDARWRLYDARDGALRGLIEQALRELGSGEAGAALVLGRELHFCDHDETREASLELLVGAYLALGRNALADIARVHHRHRDLRSVGIYRDAAAVDAPPPAVVTDRPPPTPLQEATKRRNYREVGRLAKEGGLEANALDEAARALANDLRLFRWGGRNDNESECDALVSAFEALLEAGGGDIVSGLLSLCLIYVSANAGPDTLAKAARPGAASAHELLGHQLIRGDRRLVDLVLARWAHPKADARLCELAVGTGEPDLVELMLSASPEGFDPKAHRANYLLFEDRERPAGGATLLHLAVCAASPAVVRLLLERGLDPAIKDEAGETPRDLARLLWVPRAREASDMFALFDAFAPPSPPPAPVEDPDLWRPGMKVTHAKFGEGEVIGAEGKGGEAKLKVCFVGGEKVLAARFVKRL